MNEFPAVSLPSTPREGHKSLIANGFIAPRARFSPPVANFSLCIPRGSEDGQAL